MQVPESRVPSEERVPSKERGPFDHTDEGE